MIVNSETVTIVDEEERQILESHEVELQMVELGAVSKDTKGFGRFYSDGGIGHAWA